MLLFASLLSLLQPLAITGGIRYLRGFTISLSDTTIGGTWSSSNTALATVGSVSGVVTGVAAGSVTITYTTSTGFVTKGVAVNPLPTAYPVTGGGGYCAGGAGVSIGLSVSEAVNYQLYYGGLIVGSPIPGSGLPINFGYQTAAGTYSIVATNPVTGCAATMTGSAVVSLNPSPGVYAVTGGGSYCTGGSGLPVSLNSSETGVHYQVFRNGIPTGSAFPGTNAAIDFGLQTAAGTYSIVATNAVTGCTSSMSGSGHYYYKPGNCTTSGHRPFLSVYRDDNFACRSHCWRNVEQLRSGRGYHKQFNRASKQCLCRNYFYQLYNSVRLLCFVFFNCGQRSDTNSRFCGSL